MKKILMMLGLLTIGAAPLAASAHTDVRVGFNIGAPAYYGYNRVVVSRPYYPLHRVVYETYDDGYYYDSYRPVVVYRERGWGPGWDRGRREHGRWHH